jgi:hypothetical protein
MELLKIWIFCVLLLLAPITVCASENAAFGATVTYTNDTTWVYHPTSLGAINDGSHSTQTYGGLGAESASHAYTQQLASDLAYISMDLGSIMTLDSLKVNFKYFRSGGSNTGYVDFKVSSDNVTWFLVKEYSTGVNTETTVNESITNANLSNVRYIRTSSWYQTYYAPSALYVRYYELEAIRKPVPIYPTNGSTLSFTYPPISSNINFTWTGENGSYNLYVAKDQNFNLIAVDTTLSTNYSIQSLEAGDYWWKVRYYEPSTGIYHNWSNTSNFTLTSSQTISGSGIQGIIYELVGGVKTPLSGATVFISNLTFTDSMMTGSNGYYLFDFLANDTYTIVARTTGYDDSQTEIITTNGSIQTKNIRMNKCVSSYTCNYDSKFVKFIVVDIWASRYSNVVVTAYKDSEVLASHTGTTGNDGDVTFFMVKTQSYRITFVDAAQGINLERTITPGEEIEYYILITPTSAGNWWTNTSYTETGSINFVVTTSEKNSTHAYINATYTDNLNQSTWTVYLNQTNHTNGSAPQIMLQSTTGANNGTASFVVSGYKGKNYLVNLVATHTTFGNVKRSFGVGFKGLESTSLDYISNLFKALIAIGIMIFVGAMFGYDSRNQGAGVVCALGWIFLGIGFFAYFDTVSMAAGLSIATIFAIFLNMNERAKQEDMT